MTALPPPVGVAVPPPQPARPRADRRAHRLTPGRVGLYAVLVLAAAVQFAPLYWLVISTLKTPQEFGSIPPTWFPQQATLDAYATVFTDVPFGRSILNSVLITGVCSLSVLVTSTMAGYVFAKYRFAGRDAIFWAVIATMFLPPIITLVPLYHLVSSMGLSDSYAGVMLPWLVNAFGIFLMRQFIADVPDELIDAARIDGASEPRILVRVVAPLLRPAVVTLLVFTVVYYWNNFLWPLSILQSEAKYPVVLTLSRLLSYTMSVGYQNVVMAGALVASLPTLVVFLLAQRVFVQGIARTGVK
ncbi:carbohydrate ABC transporter permease [Georgenia sp. AZ-5]|uniref:carbohydrate ABC transporter permease n=1 Tax=Georgenia sp. AZ-5 TaxID=3367526 RepID=UPI0037543EF3